MGGILPSSNARSSRTLGDPISQFRCGPMSSQTHSSISTAFLTSTSPRMGLRSKPSSTSATSTLSPTASESRGKSNYVGTGHALGDGIRRLSPSSTHIASGSSQITPNTSLPPSSLFKTPQTALSSMTNECGLVLRRVSDSSSVTLQPSTRTIHSLSSLVCSGGPPSPNHNLVSRQPEHS
jgi:hypothetical protein